MNVVRYNTNFPTLFDSFFRVFEAPEAERAFTPKADVTETEKAIEIHLDMPGVNPDEIEVKLDENVLTVSTDRKLSAETEKNRYLRQERHFGKFTRSFTLPNTVDGTKPDAAYRHGVLTLTLPKKEEVQPKTFKVRVAA